MADGPVDVLTGPDGSLVLQPHGAIGPDDAVELRQTLVHAVRHIRPLRLILDLQDVSELDPINLGTLAAACTLGDDHHVVIFVDRSTTAIADQLTAAGVPYQRLRQIR
jgi:anti-anti-sigma regulatory factor